VNKTTVLVIEEQELFRAGVSQVLSAYSGFEVTECVPSEEALRSLGTVTPDVILLGCRLSAPGDLDFGRRVALRFPNATVIILSSDPDDEELFDAIKSSTVACVNKNASGDQLVSTIREASINGQPPMEGPQTSSAIARMELWRAMRRLRSVQPVDDLGTATPGEPLTSREVQILNYIAEGKSNKQIASALRISEQTIKNHVSHILRRSKANDRAHAVFLAIRRGLISVETGQAG
jgi:DNA-binding NarL/FixJ family response regulator